MSTPSYGATDRQEKILATAAEIFWTKGYHATSMNDVAEAMNMRKASLYHHISSKEQLLYQISLSSMYHIIDAFGASTGANAETRLHAIIVNHVRALLNDRNWHATGLVELRSLPPEQRREIIDLRRKYEGLMDTALLDVQQQTNRWAGVPTSVVRMAVLGMLNWAVFWYNPDGPQTPDSIATNFAAIFLPSLPNS